MATTYDPPAHLNDWLANQWREVINDALRVRREILCTIRDMDDALRKERQRRPTYNLAPISDAELARHARRWRQAEKAFAKQNRLIAELLVPANAANCIDLAPLLGEEKTS